MSSETQQITNALQLYGGDSELQDFANQLHGAIKRNCPIKTGNMYKHITLTKTQNTATIRIRAYSYSTSVYNTFKRHEKKYLSSVTRRNTSLENIEKYIFSHNTYFASGLNYKNMSGFPSGKARIYKKGSPQRFNYARVTNDHPSKIKGWATNTIYKESNMFAFNNDGAIEQWNIQ